MLEKTMNWPLETEEMHADIVESKRIRRSNEGQAYNKNYYVKAFGIQNFTAC